MFVARSCSVDVDACAVVGKEVLDGAELACARGFHQRGKAF